MVALAYTRDGVASHPSGLNGCLPACTVKTITNPRGLTTALLYHHADGCPHATVPTRCPGRRIFKKRGHRFADSEEQHRAGWAHITAAPRCRHCGQEDPAYIAPAPPRQPLHPPRLFHIQSDGTPLGTKVYAPGDRTTPLPGIKRVDIHIVPKGAVTATLHVYSTVEADFIAHLARHGVKPDANGTIHAAE